MDAPTYPPAARFEPPTQAPYEMRLSNLPMEELIKNEAAWAIVLKHYPMAKSMTANPLAQPQMGNMTVRDFASFVGQQNAPEFAVIDEELSRLPSSPGDLP